MAHVTPPPRYDDRTIALHWVTAALVVLLWTVAQVIDFFPKGMPRISARSVHMSLGVILGFVLVARIGWRATGGTRLPRATPELAGRLAEIGHYALYVLVAVTVLLGVMNVWARGDSYFGLFKVPSLAPGNARLKETIEDLHAWCANSTLILAGLHAAAALVHRYVLRDEVLQRMLPRRDG